MAKTIQEMTTEVVAYNYGKGWRDRPVSFGEAMALLHSEVSEALEAYRKWETDDATARVGNGDPRPKPEGVGSEFADVFIRLLDDCDRFGIDLEFEYNRKMHYNNTRAYRHGGKNL